MKQAVNYQVITPSGGTRLPTNFQGQLLITSPNHVFCIYGADTVINQCSAKYNQFINTLNEMHLLHNSDCC